MFRAAANAIAMFFSTLTATLIVNPTWWFRAAWIVSIAATVIITRGCMVYWYGNKRAATFKAERDTARAALAELQIASDLKVHVYRDAAIQRTVQGLVNHANDRE